MKEDTKTTFKIMMTLLLIVFSMICIGLMFETPSGIKPTDGMQIFLGFQAAIYELMAMIVYFNKIKD